MNTSAPLSTATSKHVYDGLVSRHLNRYVSRPLAWLLCSTPVTPNQVSFAALGLAGVSCLSFLKGHPALGGVLAQASSVVDGADGDLARMKHATSRFGGFLDAVLDRYADALMILGLTYYAANQRDGAGPWLAGFAALAGTFGISYSRARIEGAPRTMFDRGAVSLASRDVRLLIIMLGGVFGRGNATLLLLAALTNSVLALRLLSAYRAFAVGRPGEEGRE